MHEMHLQGIRSAWLCMQADPMKMPQDGPLQVLPASRRAHMATAFHFLISKRLPVDLPLPFFSSGCGACCPSSTCVSTDGGRHKRSVASWQASGDSEFLPLLQHAPRLLMQP